MKLTKFHEVHVFLYLLIHCQLSPTCPPRPGAILFIP